MPPLFQGFLFDLGRTAHVLTPWGFLCPVRNSDEAIIPSFEVNTDIPRVSPFLFLETTSGGLFV